MNKNFKESRSDQILRETRALRGSVDRLQQVLIKSPNGARPEKMEREADPGGKGYGARLSSVLHILSTVALAFLTLVTGYVALRYDVSVTPYSSLNPTDPGQTRFLVTNEGPFPILNVAYLCKYVPPHLADTPLVAHASFVPAAVPSLRPHGEFSAYCEHPVSYPYPFPEGTLLDLEVTYTPKFLFWESQRGGTLFLLKFDKNKNAVWLPARDMTPGADDLKKLNCLTCSQQESR